MFNALLMVQFNTLAMLTPPMMSEYLAVVPAAIAAVTALLVILIDGFHRGDQGRGYLANFSAVGLGVLVLSCWMLWDKSLELPAFHGMLYLDKFTLLFAVLAGAAGILTMMMSPRYLRSHLMDRAEFYVLVLFSISGVIILAGAADLLTFFLGFEVMSIPVYVVAGFLRKDSRSAEAGMKYFFLGAFSAGMMLYGIALIYGITGTTNLEYIGLQLTELMANPESAKASLGMVAFGVLLILSGLAFKASSVPFHFWTPDVYTGAPSTGTGFMATAVKAGAFAAIMRVFLIAFSIPELQGGFFGYGWVDAFLFIAAASMLLGNLVAIKQDNVKRMLAYSSIAHAGYILLGFTAAASRPEFFVLNDAVIFYLFTYTFATLGAFGVLAWFGRRGETAETYDQLAGLGFKYPVIGLCMGIFMFSSAGIPPLAGFVGKLYIFQAAVEVGSATGEFAFIGLSIFAVLTSLAGVYYYLRVIVSMYMKPVTRDIRPAASKGARYAIVVCAILTLYIGIVPGRVMGWATEAMVDFRGAPAAVQEVIEAGRADLERLEQRKIANEAK
ncbi:NADH-quinone oxidoreductase subunit N [Bradymonas sediminis]|uniref:NADH-quinone oxidoreductase subunit N n=1 Tax=Bradymonas sediminis TaxID=1548548 RepID=A0A2Z4FKW8_9DELT|nr:NADH-quinone oxidoreductase subunit N [Bradymonas sediminis]AWV89637.1 NADH-quinone oxidoreductase subunit N [Bradymonas sediminis]TDP76623.1 NADH dehydrogenase subunit N [Bradymonas sediminis]